MFLFLLYSCCCISSSSFAAGVPRGLSQASALPDQAVREGVRLHAGRVGAKADVRLVRRPHARGSRLLLLLLLAAARAEATARRTGGVVVDLDRHEIVFLVLLLLLLLLLLLFCRDQ